MTVAELRKALEPYSGDQYVYIRLHSEKYPGGASAVIQCVTHTPPWYEGPPDLVALVAHATNKKVV